MGCQLDVQILKIRGLTVKPPVSCSETLNLSAKTQTPNEASKKVVIDSVAVSSFENDGHAVRAFYFLR